MRYILVTYENELIVIKHALIRMPYVYLQHDIVTSELLDFFYEYNIIN